MVRIVRTGRIIQKLAKNGRVLSGASFNTLEDAKRLETQYREDLAAGHRVEIGIKREFYLNKKKKMDKVFRRNASE